MALVIYIDGLLHKRLHGKRKALYTIQMSRFTLADDGFATGKIHECHHYLVKQARCTPDYHRSTLRSSEPVSSSHSH